MTLAKRHSDDWETQPIGTGKRLAELEAALEDIADPLRSLHRRANEQGSQLNAQAYSIAHDVGFLTGIARKALTRNNGE